LCIVVYSDNVLFASCINQSGFDAGRAVCDVLYIATQCYQIVIDIAGHAGA
jgi:hypothetical protein